MEEVLKGAKQASLAAGRWLVDPVHSQVAFTVIDRQDLKIVGGRFTDFSGEILVEDGGESTVEGLVKVASLTTDNDERDQDLRSADYLDAETWPEFQLEKSRIDWRPNGALAIDGNFVLRSGSESIPLEGELIRVGQDGKGNERVVLIASGSLPWGSFEVRLMLGVSAIRDAS